MSCSQSCLIFSKEDSTCIVECFILYLFLHKFDASLNESCGLSDIMWQERDNLPTESDQTCKSCNSMTPLTFLRSFLKVSISKSNGEPSIRTLKQSLRILVVVNTTIIEKMKVQIGSAIEYSGLQ